MLEDSLLYHGLVFFGTAAVADGADGPLWKGLVQSLVDELHSLNDQLSFSLGEERGFFSGPTMLACLGGLLDDPFIVPAGFMRPSMVEPSAAGGGEGLLTAGIFAVELRGSSCGGSC